MLADLEHTFNMHLPLHGICSYFQPTDYYFKNVINFIEDLGACKATRGMASQIMFCKLGVATTRRGATSDFAE